MYVPKRRTLASTASKMCLRESPTRFTIEPSLDVIAIMGGILPSSATPKKHLDMMTTRSRGMLYSFRALPTSSSDLPMLYTSAVSHVLIPIWYAWCRSGRDSSSFSTHSNQSGVPYDMHPRITRETFKPDSPSRTYSMVVAANN